MLSFSQNRGLTPIMSVIQKDGADITLRNALWNLVYVYYTSDIEDQVNRLSGPSAKLFTRLWLYHFNQLWDEMPSDTSRIVARMKKQFLSDEWYLMYDLLQFLPNNYVADELDPENKNEDFIEQVNEVLANELSAYRFVGTILTDITSEEEIQAVDEALNSRQSSMTQVHLKRALELYSDKNNPDYRNSIKESISAVETLCREITSSPNITLANALKQVEGAHEIHPALKKTFITLYGYTSDESGIRHALKDQDNVEQEDAKFMLVACSGFINYLLVKVSKQKID